MKGSFVKQNQEEYKKLLKTVESGEKDEVFARMGRLLSTEAEHCANVLFSMNDQYDRLPTSHQIGPSEIQSFDQLQAEAVRRTGKEVGEAEGQLRRKFESMLRKEAEVLYAKLEVPKIAGELTADGINRESLRDWDDDTVKELMRRWPGLVKNRGSWGLDEAAGRHGYESEEDLLQALMSVPTKAAFIEQHIANGMRAHRDEIGMTAVERQHALVGNEINILNEM